ncbi:conjugative transposon protein TraK [uncultured Polaribacter sp.]|uniref:conjugative transposon protein TraK n=1 Tax=uncultured Polaribacter sp. TaxID=174711 RepID=UPI002639A6FB|nr:conjugative transposon protein TraK [uncultured Polaribacter sp.]
MEFKTLTTVESSFKQIRLLSMLFVVLCAGIVGYVVFSSYQFAEAQRQKIYVLDKGKSLMLALSQDASLNRPVEAREHIRRFHELFFTLAPDNKAIESNIKRALFMADRSAFDYYKDLSEKGYYNRMISGNIHQRIVIDSIQTNFDTYPYAMVLYAKQWIIRASNKTQRSLVTSCQLINSVRSDNNPQGFTIENFRVLVNKNLQTIKR